MENLWDLTTQKAMKATNKKGVTLLLKTLRHISYIFHLELNIYLYNWLKPYKDRTQRLKFIIILESAS